MRSKTQQLEVLLGCRKVKLEARRPSVANLPANWGGLGGRLGPRCHGTTSTRKPLHVRQKEGNIAVLKCGELTKGTVTWSRDVNGQRVDILTTHNGNRTKYIADPGRRYTVGANLALSIFRVSQSDAGRYYCSGATVELTVASGTSRQTDDPKLGHSDVLKVMVGTVAGCCVVAVVLLTSLGRYLYKMRELNKIAQLYANVQMP
ncbi:hypothetical protein AOLI_G00188550 [Acnodon oligacanthus]